VTLVYSSHADYVLVALPARWVILLVNKSGEKEERER
jgi:hypothetical protein